MDKNSPCIFFQMQNLELNKDIEDFMPHFEYMGMLVTYRYLEAGKKAISDSRPVYKDYCQSLGLDPDRLMDMASDSMGRHFSPRLFLLSDYANQIKGLSEATDLYSSPSLSPDAIYLCTNQYSLYGAHFLYTPNVLNRIARLFRESYYIVPSSIHEFLILPLSFGKDAKYLSSLLSYMNSEEMSVVNILSNNIFIYDLNEEKLAICPIPV